jgi:hypothetical protein
MEKGPQRGLSSPFVLNIWRSKKKREKRQMTAEAFGRDKCLVESPRQMFCFNHFVQKKASNAFFLACIHLHVGKNVRLFNRVLQEQNKHFFPMSRVTRLADFSHIRLLFSFGSFLKIAEIAQMLRLLSFHVKQCITFDKKRAGLHFGPFF